jgi:hypothetical protein
VPLLQALQTGGYRPILLKNSVLKGAHGMRSGFERRSSAP